MPDPDAIHFDFALTIREAQFLRSMAMQAIDDCQDAATPCDEHHIELIHETERRLHNFLVRKGADA
jgi:hypothetical protein